MSHLSFNFLDEASKLLLVHSWLAHRLKGMLMKTYVQSSFKSTILNIYFQKHAKNRHI